MQQLSSATRGARPLRGCCSLGPAQITLRWGRNQSTCLTSQGFASRGFYDETQAVVRYAQKTAIAWRRTIVVCVEADKLSAISNSDCNAPVYVPHPANPANPLKTQAAPSGVTLTSTSGSSFSFDGLGRPSAATTITLNSTNTDDPARVIIVATETGYVYH